MKRALGVSVLALLAACGAEKAPKVVDAGESAACKADTSTLKSIEETSFAATNSYTEQATPLHKVTVAGETYTITVNNARCGTVGHTPRDY